jgi:hypothetical protein
MLGMRTSRCYRPYFARQFEVGGTAIGQRISLGRRYASFLFGWLADRDGSDCAHARPSRGLRFSPSPPGSPSAILFSPLQRPSALGGIVAYYTLGLAILGERIEARDLASPMPRSSSSIRLERLLVRLQRGPMDIWPMFGFLMR